MERLASFLILLFSVTISPAASQATECSDGGTPPPVWLFVLPEDLASSFPDLEITLIVIEEGVVNPLLQDNDDDQTTQLRFGRSVRGIPMVWCSDGVEGVDYVLSVTSSDTSILLDPESTIPRNGTIPPQPYRFRVLFECVSNGIAHVRVEANVSTADRFCVLRFAFGKDCGLEEVGESGYPEELGDQVDGFVNTTVKDVETAIVQSDSSSAPLEIILPCVLIPSIVLLLVLLVLFIGWLKWYRSRSKAITFQPEAVIMAYQETHPAWDHQREPHRKEFPRQQLELTRELGEGAFGVVYEGQAEDILKKKEKTVVAVKQLKGSSDPSVVDNFFREVDFMAKLEHPNIVNLLGVCSMEEPFCMIFEYMDLGDLCSFLREAVGLGGDCQGEELEDPLLTEQELVHIAHQVAKGMEYISSQHLVHRDLATRNCLVATGLIVKIADFGMSRDVHSSDYYRVKGSAVLPVRWMPPESILYGKFTTETDVWAFGVLLWEVFTFAQQPYPGMTNEEVIEHVQKGGHPEPPKECPEAVVNLMLRCLERNPRKRPGFAAIVQTLGAIVDEEDTYNH